MCSLIQTGHTLCVTLQKYQYRICQVVSCFELYKCMSIVYIHHLVFDLYLRQYMSFLMVGQ